MDKEVLLEAAEVQVTEDLLLPQFTFLEETVEVGAVVEVLLSTSLVEMVEMVGQVEEDWSLTST